MESIGDREQASLKSNSIPEKSPDPSCSKISEIFEKRAKFFKDYALRIGDTDAQFVSLKIGIEERNENQISQEQIKLRQEFALRVGDTECI